MKVLGLGLTQANSRVCGTNEADAAHTGAEVLAAKV